MKFPFTTTLETEDVVRILSLAGISLEIDGVLAQGEKGTAESIMARAFTDVVRNDLQAKGAT